jgi:hypothetical protein
MGIKRGAGHHITWGREGYRIQMNMEERGRRPDFMGKRGLQDT